MLSVPSRMRRAPEYNWRQCPAGCRKVRWQIVAFKDPPVDVRHQYRIDAASQHQRKRCLGEGARFVRRGPAIRIDGRTGCVCAR
jgi:hypothetical protein